MSDPVRPSGDADGEPFDLRLLPLAMGTWAAAWWGTDPSLAAGGVVLVMVALLAAQQGRSRGRAAAVAVLLVTAAAGGLGVARHHQLASSAAARLGGERAAVTAVVRLDGDVVRHPAHGVVPESATATGTLLVVDGRGTAVRQRVPVDLRATGAAGQALRQVPAGTTLRLTGRLAAADPGRRSAATLTVRGSPVVEAGPGRTARAVNDLRRGLRQAMAHSRPAQAGLVPSLVVGDTSGLDPALADDFRDTALTHLTAVSGTNLTLTLAFLLTVARAVGVRGWWVRAVGVAGVAGFVLVCRAEPSVVRASAMGLVTLAGMGVSGGRGRGLRNLFAAVWLLLLLDPWLARSVGFTLSVLATGGILWWARDWAAAMGRWAPVWLAESITVPLAAQLVTQPVVTAISGTVSVVGLLANALAEPFVGPTTVLGLATMLLAQLSPGLAGITGWLAGWLVQPVITIATTGARLPAATWRWPARPVMLVVLAGLCLAAAVLVPRVVARRRACLLLALLLVAACWRAPHPAGWPGPWQVAFCDVGQGDATVLRTAPGRAVLVDTGPADGDVTACLDALGVRALPIVVLTHYHDDHVAGLEDVLRHLPVGQLVVNPVQSPAAGAERVARLAARHHVAVRPAAAGEHLVVGELDWTVAGVGARDVLVASAEGENSAENDTSIVAVATTGGVRVVVGGDVEPAGQQHVVATGWHPAATVLKMPHHGSSRQDLAFWCDSGARLAVASAGYRNTYGHPARAALALARHCGMDVARTDLQGTVTAWLADGRLQVRSARDGPP